LELEKSIELPVAAEAASLFFVYSLAISEAANAAEAAAAGAVVADTEVVVDEKVCLYGSKRLSLSMTNAQNECSENSTEPIAFFTGWKASAFSSSSPSPEDVRRLDDDFFELDFDFFFEFFADALFAGATIA
jgi:hypothetical protein